MGNRRDHSASRSAGLLLVALLWTLFLVTSGSPEAILFTVPVFLLAAPLAFGRYVGVDLVIGLRPRRRRPTAPVPHSRLTGSSDVLLGWIESGLAPGRAPPAAL